MIGSRTLGVLSFTFWLSLVGAALTTTGCRPPAAKVNTSPAAAKEPGPSSKKAEGRPGEPPTVSLKQLKAWAEAQSVSAGGKRFVAYEIAYQGSDAKYHYFFHPKPYYRVLRQDLPELKTTDGGKVLCPKDSPDRYYPLTKDLRLKLSVPGSKLVKLSRREADARGIRVSVTPGGKAASQVLRVVVPEDASGEPGLELDGCKLLHTVWAPRRFAVDKSAAPKKGEKAYGTMIDAKEVQNCTVRVMFATIPGGIDFDLRLKDFVASSSKASSPKEP